MIFNDFHESAINQKVKILMGGKFAKAHFHRFFISLEFARTPLFFLPLSMALVLAEVKTLALFGEKKLSISKLGITGGQLAFLGIFGHQPGKKSKFVTVRSILGGKKRLG